MERLWFIILLVLDVLLLLNGLILRIFYDSLILSRGFIFELRVTSFITSCNLGY